MLIKPLAAFFSLAVFAGGLHADVGSGKNEKSADRKIFDLPSLNSNKDYKVIHVFVALCDNKYQGIVPVPAGIGNGQNASTNMYWGAGYGVKSFFKKSKDWELLQTISNPEKNIVERLLFRHKSSKTFLIADAYDGEFIRETTVDFLRAASGDYPVLILNNKDSIHAGGASNLIAYIGHDGLMDFELAEKFPAKNSLKREAIILACYSKHFYSPYLRSTGAFPLVWTSGLMAPEAYTLHDAIGVWINDRPAADTRSAAAKAYSKYQKCGIKAASNLLVQGW